MNSRVNIIVPFIFVLLLTATVGCIKEDVKQKEPKRGEKVNIEEYGFSFQLPSEKWSFRQHEGNETIGKEMYLYKREPIIDSKNRPVIPNIGISFTRVPEDLDVLTYFANIKIALHRDLNYNSYIDKDMFNPNNFNLKNAVGHMGTLTYPDDIYPGDIEHTVVMVHAIHNGIGIQITMDITTELYEVVEEEFKYVLKTLNLD